MKTILLILVIAFGTIKAASPQQWPSSCRWPDRVLADGRKVNMRPLFNWLAAILTPEEKPRTRTAPTVQPENPMPMWHLLNVSIRSTTNAVAIATKSERQKTGEVQRPAKRPNSLSSIGGFVGSGGSRNVPPGGSTAIYEYFDKPLVVLNFPGTHRVAATSKGHTFHALWIGKTNIIFDGDAAEVDLYDHGQPVTP